MSPTSASSPEPDRRGFMAGLTAVVLGGLALLTPLAAAAVSLFSPLRRSGAGSGNKVHVTSESVAQNLRPNIPECFALSGARSDAWNTLPNETIGSIFLVRNEAGKLQAFQAICPHQGCDVTYVPTDCRFFCPCHKANFQVDGTRVQGDGGPACRDLDSLEVEVRDGEVWVDFKKFRTGLDGKVET